MLVPMAKLKSGADFDSESIVSKTCFGGQAVCQHAAKTYLGRAKRQNLFLAGVRWPAKRRKRCCSEAKPTRRGNYDMAKLYEGLQSLLPESRRTVLAKCFTEPQRLALEGWILQHRAKEAAVSAKLFGSRPATETKETSAIMSTVDCSDCCTNNTTGKHDRKCTRRGETQPRSIAGVRGIQSHRQHGCLFYSASVSVGQFSLHSKKTRDFSEVLFFRRVLLSIQCRVLSSVSRKADVAERLCQSLAAEAADGDASSLGIRFVAYVPAKYWVGKMLATPRFAVKDLVTGILAWRRLSEARSVVDVGHVPLGQQHSAETLAQVWHKLRAIYVSIWMESGHRKESVIAKLEAWENSVRVKRAANCTKTKFVSFQSSA